MSAVLPGTSPERLGRARSDGLVVVVFWAAAALASALPQILVGEVTGRAPWLLAVAQVAALLGLWAWVRRPDRFQALDGPLRWLIAMAAGWHLILGGLLGTQAWADWQHSVPWVARGAVVQVLIFVPTLLLVVLGPGRLGGASLRLRAGDDRARARAGVYTLGRRPTWRRLGTFWAVGITVGTATAMWFALGSQLDDVCVLLWSLPAIAVLAATNTVNEEFGYRNVPLAVLPPVLGPRAAVAATGLLFGLAHYYGNPPGASGVALSAFLGVLLAKSMVETGGSKWAWIIHWLQDMVIFSFLALAWSNL
ncbi:CAAX protease self-immunity [Geodermatophilus amargosae]|uniref:CAAX protease self-immunity n=1 Tax=Geodermatophilus amargosae TaxID=1296565 RepID=A0A1I7D6W8_9ACTN|nr:CPBP family intramembrane glutamic endopeptidase [Geodermatophilus amargosae]SFU07426.1 CAAX protease self-immunity [Geodermatophilus amargosae]